MASIGSTNICQAQVKYRVSTCGYQQAPHTWWLPIQAPGPRTSDPQSMLQEALDWKSRMTQGPAYMSREEKSSIYGHVKLVLTSIKRDKQVLPSLKVLIFMYLNVHSSQIYVSKQNSSKQEKYRNRIQWDASFQIHEQICHHYMVTQEDKDRITETVSENWIILSK